MAHQEKHQLQRYLLLGDPSKETLKAYKVWAEKQFMGRKFMGVMRTTFLIDEKSEILKRYDNVKPETHADMIIADVHGTKTSPTGAVVVKDLHAAKKKAVKKGIKKPVKQVTKKVVKKTAAKKKK